MADDVQQMRELAAALAEVNRRLREAEGSQKKFNAQQDQSGQALDRTVSGLESVGRVAALAGGIVQKQMAGGFLSAGDALGTFSTVAGLIPGKFGAIAGAVTGLLAPAISLVNFRWEQMVQRVGQASSSVLSGARTMREALADVRVNTLTEEFQNLNQELVRLLNPSGVMAGFRQLQGGAVNPMQFLDPNQLIQGGAQAAVDRMNQAQAATRQLFASPAFRQLSTRLGAERGAAATAAATAQTEFAGGEARSVAQSLAGGATATQARDLAQRQGMQERFLQSLRQEGETREQTAARVTQQAQTDIGLRMALEQHARRMVELEREQAATRGDVATRQLEEQNLASLEQMDILQRQTGILREQRNTLIPIIDQSRERFELDRMAREGASAEAIQNRQRRLEEERGVRLQQQRVQFANQAVERNRRPLERFRLEMERLEGTRGELGEEGFRREQGRQFDALVASAGPLDRLVDSLAEQGSVAAARQIAAAEREQARGSSPQAQMQSALASLVRQGEQRADHERRQAEALESMQGALRVEGL